MADSRSNSQATVSELLKAWGQPLDPGRKAAQLVNRVTFGPRPGDVEGIRATGLQAFIDQQLHPERLDDRALDDRLAGLPTLSMSSAELMEKYPDPNQLKRQQEVMGAVADRRPGTPASMSPSSSAMGSTMGDSGDTPREVLVELGREQLLRAVYSTRQLQEVMVQFWMNHFNIFAGKGPDKWMLTSFERDTIRPRALGRFEDLLVATAQSPAMLFYLDNWMSSTPGFRPGGPAAGRPAAFPGRWRRFGGPFGGPLLGPGRQALGAPHPAPGPNARQKHGLNENYGRELMELHTLGVNGGYTQKDVIEVARCLTGWTVLRPRQEAEFFFNARMHDVGEKTVLGHKIPGHGGIEDGLQVLHLLASHPSTAQFIAAKLCRRFVADDPPPSLVERTSREFTASNGDLRVVLQSIFTSPEFSSEGAYRAKTKSPLEMVASTLRALDAQTDAGAQLLGMIGRMGEPMFQYQAPAGYPDRASTWISSSALLGRLNFATAVAENRIPGTKINLESEIAQGAGSPESIVDRLSGLLGTTLSGGSRRAILGSVGSKTDSRDPEAKFSEGFATLPAMAALVIGSPEFQRR